MLQSHPKLQWVIARYPVPNPANETSKLQRQKSTVFCCSSTTAAAAAATKIILPSDVDSVVDESVVDDVAMLITGNTTTKHMTFATITYEVTKTRCDNSVLLWPPYVADADTIFLPCGFFFLPSFFFRLLA